MPEARQLAAIMFTDIVGYTSLMGEDEASAYQLLKKNRQVQKPLIEKHSGKWLKEMGDGVLASFSTVSDAVYCALAIQKACQKEPDLKLRIGLHQGEVIVEDGDVFGDGVNIASRLEPLAPAGSIYASESVYRNIQNKKSIVASFIREEALKNVKHPVKIYEIQAAEGTNQEEDIITVPHSNHSPIKTTGTFNWKKILYLIGPIIVLLTAIYFLYPTQEKEGIEEIDKSIAVLPFKNMSQELGSQYFADGVMEAILNNLSRIGELRIISRTSVEQYRTSSKTIPQIGDELDVTHILEGSAQQYGDKVRITVQLIDTRQDKHLWSESYDREMTDIFATQSEIAKNIAATLETKLTSREKELIESIATENIMAYDFYLRAKEYARRYQNLRENPDYENAMNLYQRSLELDPNFALAYVGIAEIYYTRNRFRDYMLDQPLDSVLMLCNRSLDLDPNLTEAYLIRGNYFYFIENSLSKAMEDCYQALLIDPNNAAAMLLIANIYNWELETSNAFKFLLKASRLIKGSQLPELYLQFGILYMNVSNYPMAEKFFNEALKIQPDLIAAYDLLAHINSCQERWDKNLKIADKLIEINAGSSALYELAIIHMMNGQYEESEKFFRQLYASRSDVIELQGYNDKHMYSYVLIKNGKVEEARKNLIEILDYILKAIDLKRQWANHSGYELAKIYALLGNKKEALKWLQQYHDSNQFGFGLCDFAEYDPPFESLRNEPQFKQILREAKEAILEKRLALKRLEASEELKSRSIL
jgi:TolB-like protein/class 3 adenylate cyclase/Tfp pilus assembly protein PilF